MRKKDTNFEILEKLLEEFWFAPQDALMRAVEVILWSKQLFKRPILDIGCGDGTNSKLLFSKHGKIDVGLDLDPMAVKKARKSGVYEKVVVSDAERLPFGNKRFETVVSNSTFEHILDDILAVKEVGRVLKNRGRFLFTVPTPRFLGTIKKLVKGQKFKKFNSRVSIMHYHEIEEWQQILKSFKLEIVECQYYFPEEVVRAWYPLFKLAIMKPYRRELWSYLRDSPYGKLAPKRLLIYLEKIYLKKVFKKVFDKKGTWFFISSIRESSGVLRR